MSAVETKHISATNDDTHLSGAVTTPRNTTIGIHGRLAIARVRGVGTIDLSDGAEEGCQDQKDEQASLPELHSQPLFFVWSVK